MRQLQVTDFSCIKSARLELGSVTVLIGPQASGKSVLTKLAYFAIDIGTNLHQHLINRDSLEKLSAAVKGRFVDWFPREAWGSGKFKIHFQAGDYAVSFARRIYRGKISDEFQLKFSAGFVATYASLLTEIGKTSSTGNDAELGFLEREMRIRDISQTRFSELMGQDAVQYQAFVPAGRSFFTSLGKAIAAFEHGRVLDPLIVRFGRMYTVYKERAWRVAESRSKDREGRRVIDAAFASILGGKLQREGEREYIAASDGRKIPLSALSSGQQELLPIVTFVPWLWGGAENKLCYIEEPEAHLFPATQARLVQSLIMAARGASLVLTTHSPYVLGKINNLLKADAMTRDGGEVLRKEVEAIIPRKAWLPTKDVRAYAIREGELVSLIDDTGLVDGDYLDGVSSELGAEFDSLLDVESRHHER